MSSERSGRRKGCQTCNLHIWAPFFGVFELSGDELEGRRGNGGAGVLDGWGYQVKKVGGRRGAPDMQFPYPGPIFSVLCISKNGIGQKEENGSAETKPVSSFQCGTQSDEGGGRVCIDTCPCLGFPELKS